jgi:hypothetical protein
MCDTESIYNSTIVSLVLMGHRCKCDFISRIIKGQSTKLSVGQARKEQEGYHGCQGDKRWAGGCYFLSACFTWQLGYSTAVRPASVETTQKKQNRSAGVDDL